MTSTTLSVAAKVTTRTIAVLADEIRSASTDHSAINLDIANVEYADLSFVQLIEAARRHLPERSLSLDGPANALVAALLRRAGFLTAPTPADIDFWFHGALPQ